MEELKAPPLGSVLGERYRLLRFLGSGAMGAVYEAATPSDERFALKVLLEMDHRLAAELEQRFVREASVSAQLKSKNVVPVVDSGMDAALQVPYLVMPLLSGFDLETLLERTGALHPTVGARIVAQACAGLMDAHRAGVVHRDIKPGNVFLAHDPNGNITVRVLDFGMAKATASDEAITRAGSILGTPHYMSPEQSKNAKDADARTDVWGIGATLYHVLCGCPPFDEVRTFADLHLAINTDDVPWLQDRAPWIDQGLARVVHGALLRDLDQRCGSMSELRTALLPYMDDATDVNTMMLEPVPAFLRKTRAPRGERITAWTRSAPTGELPAISALPIDPLLGKRLGQYKIVRRLGGGRTAGLYEAVDGHANRFAVRVVESREGKVDAAATRRFVREARALATIHSPHVVDLIDAAFDEALGQPYAVLALLHGQDLRQLIAKHGPLDPKIAVPLAIQACRGLMAAHAGGAVHRDVRPGNLFLVEEPSGEVTVKLTGFGLVKRVARADDASYAVTLGSDVIGSPMYMSPEQSQNATKVDVRSDVYSLGASLFVALAGVPPWPEDLGTADLIIELGTGRPRHIQDSAPWVPRRLVEIVHKAMKRDPADRFATVADMLAALEQHGPHQPVMLKQLEPISSDRKKRVEARADPIVTEAPKRVVVRVDPELDPSVDESLQLDVSRAIPLARQVPPPSRAPMLALLVAGLLAVVAVAAYVGWLAAGP
jgi:serine/threonine protein kinase